MKKTPTLLGLLTRADVTELVLCSGQRARGKTPDGIEPIGDGVLSPDSILDLLFAAGGSRYVDSLGTTPTQWRTRVDGVGPVHVSAVLRGEALEARIVPLERPTVRSRDLEPPSPGRRPRPRTSIPAKSIRKAATMPVMARRGMTKPPPRSPQPRSASQPPPTAEPRTAPSNARDADRDADTVPPRAARGAAPGVKLSRLLVEARNAGATELHFVPGRAPLARVHGELLGRGDALDRGAIETLLSVVLTPEHLSILSADGSTRVACELQIIGRLRVDVARERGGLAAAFRILPTEVLDLGKLGVPDEAIACFRAPRGLILIASPPGGGKSTTAASIVEALAAERPRTIVVLQEMIETPLRARGSLLTHRTPGLPGMLDAIRASSSPRPDVLAVDMVRGATELAAALDVADAGSLVIATVEAPGPQAAVARLIASAGIRSASLRRALARNLRCVLAQRVGRVEGRMRASFDAMVSSPSMVRWIEADGAIDPPNILDTGGTQPRPPRKEMVPQPIRHTRRDA